ncbi:MAG TPA: BrnT family toxin [Longimicrobiaceae bacterium]|nr:BrnT family toxin [Longimicrobiaceae bacterium]
MYILDPREPLEFEWDERKCQANLAKQGIDFEDAARVFDGPTLEGASNRDGEERRLAVGVVEEREVAVVYTVREGRYRIISARRARRYERRAYRAAYPGHPDRGTN